MFEGGGPSGRIQIRFIMKRRMRIDFVSGFDFFPQSYQKISRDKVYIFQTNICFF